MTAPHAPGTAAGPAPDTAAGTAPGTGPDGAPAVPPEVAQALARLVELDARPVNEHVEVFDGVHRLLQDALATLDEA